MPSDVSQTIDASESLASAIPEAVPLPTNVLSEDEQDKFFDFASVRTHLKRLIDDWHTEVEDTEVRRKERKIEIDIEGLRQKGDMDEDETLVPIRIIDSNIQREIPPYINYLKNSRRVAIFENLDDPNNDTDNIEEDFTRKATYSGWEIPLYKCIDGAMAHGWDAVEVVYDENKPGHFAVEHIAHDKLFFPRSAIDLQQCPRIIRCYDVTILQLRKWIQDYGFDSGQCDNIFKKRKETSKENETIRIYRLYFKKSGIVQVAWFCLQEGETDWLKAPVKLYCGVDEKVDPTELMISQLLGQQINPWREKSMQLYPIFILPYRTSEEQKITDNKGRGFIDCYKQEAQTALWSAFVNGMTRASNIYASPATEDGSGSSLKELENVKMSGGRILSKPIQFFSPPYPDAVILRSLQFADVQNDQETNQVNFAAMNREDSRKTAKEIGAAQQQQTLLNSVQLTLFSTFIRQVYSFAWLIVQSQALQGKIKFLLIQQQTPQNPQMNGASQAPQLVNDTATIGMNYDIRAAGDVDVIQKDEMIAKMQQDMQLAMQTPLKDQFIMDYFKLKYPESTTKYMNILAQSNTINQMKGLIGQLGAALNGVIKDAPQVMETLPQQQKADLGNLLAEANQFVGGGIEK